MPPKKPDAPSKKTDQKKKEKVIEDKTFGLKNKKGTKQKKFIEAVSKQVTYGNKNQREIDKLNQDKLSKKDEKKKLQDELSSLFRPVEQKVDKGTDPKSVLCSFFKLGQCTKGDRCKFSHDLTIGRKAEKRSIYTDTNNPEEEETEADGMADGMAQWDAEKLEEVIAKKHGAKNKNLPKTAIVCKFFLEALENSKYGWFWQCPNGEKCHYIHALPAGFVLKKDKIKMDDQKDPDITLEELIEKERATLSSKNLTRVTIETFLKWKERKKREKVDKLQACIDKKKADYSAGKSIGVSGRLQFEFNPDLVDGDQDDEGGETYNTSSLLNEEDDEGPVREINLEMFSYDMTSSDGSGTQIPPGAKTANGHRTADRNIMNGLAGSEEESDKLDMAAGGSAPNTNPAAEGSDIIADDAAIDENLFDGEDLDLVEEELETLELDD